MLLVKRLLLGALALAPAALYAQQYDEAGARRAVQGYLDGMTKGDTTALLRVFDRNGFLDAVKQDGSLDRLPVPQWAAGWNGKSLDPARYQARILGLDLHDNAGYAKVELNWPKVHYVDYLALLRVGSEWKIVSKIWHEEAPGAAATARDEAGITTAVQAYFDAVNQNSKSAVTRAFHPDAFIITSRADRMNRAPFAQWSGFANDKASADAAQRKSKIVSIDQAGERAVAKVDLEWPDLHYVDYLSLMKFGSEWRIINKVWFGEPSKQSLAEVQDLKLTEEQMKPYLGKYAIEGRVFEVLVTEGHLALRLPGTPPLELMAQGNHEFAVSISPRDRVIFTVVNGRSTQMEMRQVGRGPMIVKRAE